MAGPLKIGAGLTTLGTGVAGFGDDAPVTTTGSGTNEGNQASSGNQNTFSNQNLTTWLSQLLSAFQESQSTSTTNFNLDPSTKALIEKLTGQYSALTNPFSSQNYQAGQIQNINANSDLQRQAADNIMAARGVSGPAATTAGLNIDANRINNITQMQQQVPFLKDQWDTQHLAQAASFLNFIPKGTTTTTANSTQSGQSANTQGNNTASSTGGSTYYNDGWNKQTQQQTQTTKKDTNPFLKAAGLGIGVLGSLFSDETLKKEIQERPTSKAVDNIMRLRPVSWKWTKDSSSDMGVIAQDLQKVLPELVHKDPEGSGKLKVNYAGLISELVGALQAVNQKVEAIA
jgi:hypothetical protein